MVVFAIYNVQDGCRFDGQYFIDLFYSWFLDDALNSYIEPNDRSDEQ
jgi:hypothetical protein